MNLSTLREQWFGNVRADILAGMVVALALIPEAIAFSIIAGVDPKVGLYASFSMAVTIAIVGGRPGMISAATGAMALVMGSLINNYGLDYLFAATILTGFIQMGAGALKLGSLLRFVSKSVFTGFVNALAILIFMAQLPQFHHVGWQMYAMVAAGLSIIYLFPYVTRAVPSPLIAILILTTFSILTGMHLSTVGDMGELPHAMPFLHIPQVPLTLATLNIILPYSLTLAAVGLLESLMTSVIVDEMTDTSSDKNRECAGQGVANIITGFLGGMAGCAMIGQSVINVKSGGRGRLSTFFAGCFLLFLILVLDQWVKQIPMAALVSVMIMVSIGTFDWASIKGLRTNPTSSSMVMLATVCVVVATHDLAKGVFVGVLLSGIFFARKVDRLFSVQSILTPADHTRTYQVYGQIFFASAQKFANSFDYKEDINCVVIDLTQAHFWDLSAVSALDRVTKKLKSNAIDVELKGLNEASQTIVERLTVSPGLHNFQATEDKQLS